MQGAENPASRLRQILADFAVAATSQSEAIGTVWAKVRKVSEADVELEMAFAASLIRDIERKAREIDSAEAIESIAHYAPQWARAIYPRFSIWSTPSEAPRVVSADCLASLQLVSALLSIGGPKLETPDDATVESLRQDLHACLRAVLGAPDLPQDVKGVIIARIHDILWSLDHLELYGPDEAAAAVERLAGVVAMNRAAVDKAGLARRLVSVVLAAWAAFKLGPTAQHAFESWTEIVKELPPN